jgi:hypothetical protein
LAFTKKFSSTHQISQTQNFDLTRNFSKTTRQIPSIASTIRTSSIFSETFSDIQTNEQIYNESLANNKDSSGNEQDETNFWTFIILGAIAFVFFYSPHYWNPNL